ncbi:MAG TPA: phosphatase PAP2 family protein [Candidatus Saccharimonadales bacterium]|nr:phosphatase PAP2 family protein [Candidatus Saccharimonadales bacterium]
MTDYSIHEGVSKKHTSKTAKKGSNKWLIFWLLVSIVLLVGSTLVARKHQLTGLQARIFYDFNHPQLGSSFTTAAKWVTEGLGSAIPVAICVVVPLAFKKYRLAWRFLVTAGGAFVLAYIVKKIVNEPRPIVMLHGHLHQRVVETGPGFPSGHVTAATALALTLWFVLPVKWRFISIIWIVAVACSRLYLGVHTPVDIIGGFACGLLAVCVVRLLPKVIANPLRLDTV